VAGLASRPSHSSAADHRDLAAAAVLRTPITHDEYVTVKYAVVPVHVREEKPLACVQYRVLRKGR
jgi:hypothetical protein